MSTGDRHQSVQVDRDAVAQSWQKRGFSCGLWVDPPGHGGHRLFAWSGADEPAGSMANTARWPGVHPHWLFHFPVADVAAAVARVRALGGQAKDPIELLDGTSIAACGDPQGAAFGVIRRTRAVRG